MKSKIGIISNKETQDVTRKKHHSHARKEGREGSKTWQKKSVSVA